MEMVVSPITRSPSPAPSMSNHLPLPNKLEDDMKNIAKYKRESFSIEKVLNASAENSLFDEAFGPIVKRSDLKRSSDEKASEFTTILASKLADTEKENKALRNRLAISNMAITRLEESIDELNDVVKSQSSSEAIRRIRHDNTRLQRQLMEMEQFLADYGLNWVGYKSHEDTAPAGAQQKEEGHEHFADEMQGFDLFKKRIDELNLLIRDEPAKVITSSHGAGVKARLAHTRDIVESIPMTMYRDGLMIKRGPFRPAGSDSFNSFTRDVMDGYFPSEFRDSSPDGVLIELTDRRDDYFNDCAAAADSRQGEMKPADLIKKLPKTVIKNGYVMSIREDVSSKISSGEENAASSKSKERGPSKHITSGKQVVHLPTRAKLFIENDENADDEVITSIQVKWNNGRDVYILKMFGSDSVSDIKDAISAHLNRQDPNVSSSFSLRCAYPPRDLRDDLTLIEARLVPSGTLHVVMQ